MTYTYATLKEGKLYVANKERFRNQYLCLQEKEPVKIRIRIEDIESGVQVYVIGELFKGKLNYDLDLLNEKLKDIQGSSVRIWVDKVRNPNTLSQKIYYSKVILFEFIWGYYDINHEFIPKEVADDLLKQEYLYEPEKANELDYLEFDQFLCKCRGFIKTFFNRDVPLPERYDEELFKF